MKVALTEAKRSSSVLVVAATTVVALCLAALIRGGPADAAFPGANGPIAFQSDRDGPVEIYTITPGGTANRITFSTNSSDPAISPDGARIAFVNNNNQIAVMNADGTGITPLTTTSTAKQDPTWSPEGTQIAYAANSVDVDGQTDLEIWVINADGSGPTQLTSNTFPDTQPAWSPLGDQIAFVSNRTGDTNRNVYVMGANGSGQTSITPNVATDCANPTPATCYQGHDDGPAWSPDGLEIAYVHDQEPNGGGLPAIWTMDPNGANKANLSNNTAVSFDNPAWSPQGDMLAAVGTATLTTNRDIWVMTSSGTGETAIDPNAAHDINPDWGVPAPPPPPPPPPEQPVVGDTTPPETSITKGPKAKTKKKSATFEFSSTEPGSTFECQLDGKAFTPCTSPETVKVKKGKHTFEVRATDAAGNADPTSASDSWKVKKKKR